MKYIQLLAWVFILNLHAKAQEGNKLYLLQYNHYHYTSKNYDGPQLIENRKKGFPIGIQKISNQTDIRALRIGVTFTENELITPITQIKETYTTSTFNTYRIFAPTFYIGQEWQYIPLPSLMFYGGGEAGLGFMKNSFVHTETKEGHGSFSLNASVNGYAYNFNASIIPFVGARFLLYKLVLGYEISTPFRYTYVFHGPSDFSVGSLMQRFYIGYTNCIHGFKEGSCSQRFSK